MLDTANPRVDLLQAIVRITDKVPDLRVVLDHLPSLEPTPETRQAYDDALGELQKRPHVYVKLSAVIHRVNGQVSTELAPYRDRLDQLIGSSERIASCLAATGRTAMVSRRSTRWWE